MQHKLGHVKVIDEGLERLAPATNSLELCLTQDSFKFKGLRTLHFYGLGGLFKV